MKREEKESPVLGRALTTIRVTPATPPVLDGREAQEPCPRLDWSGVREGVREVFLTLAATLAIGFAWAAIERERLGAPPGAPGSVAVIASVEPVGAPSGGTGYASARGMGR